MSTKILKRTNQRLLKNMRKRGAPGCSETVKIPKFFQKALAKT